MSMQAALTQLSVNAINGGKGAKLSSTTLFTGVEVTDVFISVEYIQPRLIVPS